MKVIKTARYIESQFNSNIKLISYNEGFLRVLVYGQDKYYQDVSRDDVDRLSTYLKFWMKKKALNLLNTFHEYNYEYELV